MTSDPEAVTGSNSDELSIIGRTASLMLASSSTEEFLYSVQGFVALTHNSSKVLSAAALFANILIETLDGKPIEETLSSIDIDATLKQASADGR